MIRLLRKGRYQILNDKGNRKLLVLDTDLPYAWTSVQQDGDTLELHEKPELPSNVVASGPFRLFEVDNESALTGFLHLELFVGDGKWQGYLLPNGLPARSGVVNRIFLTTEIITTCMKHRFDFVSHRGLI